MDRTNSTPNRNVPPDLSEESKAQAKLIVKKGLGDNFSVVFDLPRNVGVSGDRGIWGNTILIAAHNEDALRLAHGNPDHLGRVAVELGNVIDGLTRVLIDIQAQSPDALLETPQL